MFEIGIPVAGASVALAVLALAPPRLSYRPEQLHKLAPARALGHAWAAQERIARGCGWRWMTALRLLALQLIAAWLGAALGWLLTGLPVLAAAGAVWGAALARAAVAGRSRASRRLRQEAVVESARLLRQLLAAGGLGVQQAVGVLAERGPAALRPEFTAVAAAAATGRQRQAWAEARARLEEPLFDLLSAAIELQRPSGGELSPLLAELESSLTAIQEVVREAEALQVQARGAAAMIVSLPFAFLLALSALHSPYLDLYRQRAGEVFLGAMLGVMGLSYVWILRWLRLPSDPRLRLADA